MLYRRAICIFFFTTSGCELYAKLPHRRIDQSPQLQKIVQEKLKKSKITSTASTEIQGVRVTCRPPIRLTTKQLMAKEHAGFKHMVMPTMRIKEQAIQANTPLILKNFNAANYNETGQYGPSADASVGSHQVILGSKGRVRSFQSDTGTIDNVLNLSHDRFFSSISLGGFTADPNIIFDTLSKQWFLFCDGGNPFLMLAMSSDDPITNDTKWSFFVVDSTVPNPGFDAILPSFDYTTLGMDETAIYCAANVFDDANPFYLSSAAYVILKDSLQEGQTPAIFAFRNLVNQITMNGPYTLQPAQNFDTETANGFFVSQNLRDILIGSSQQLLLNTVTFMPTGPVLSAPQSIAVQPFVSPIFASALGTPEPLFDPGVRLCPAHIRNGILQVVHEIGVDNTGTSTSQIVVTRNGARFYAINSNELPPVVVNQGTIFQASQFNDTNQRSFITPSLMSNAAGQVIVAATTLGTQEHLNMSVTQITNGLPGTPVLVTTSLTNYFATEDWEFDPNSRWGDHTRTSIDPNDNITFWPAGLWCTGTNTWGSQIAKVRASQI